MADHFYGAIEIAKGRYPRHIWEKMNQIAGREFEESLACLQMEDANAVNGEFSALEEYLVEQGIPFDRTSEGFNEIHPEKRIFRPALIDKVIIGDNDGDAYIKTDDLRKVLTEDKPPEDILKDIQALVDEKDPLYPPIREYTIQWTEGDSGELFLPEEQAEWNENFRVVAVLGDQK
ncbi:hypothetical protein [Paenibacillus sp. Y412MC10]|uniref:hypothetical protein n=1 Tax=Geobacillus sp. (strain Y412MC10) TaxID=481743 RepID=UPI0011AB7285|nr:hypothetical protein [Paenibacillus sp. Y412MC10]